MPEGAEATAVGGDEAREEHARDGGTAEDAEVAESLSTETAARANTRGARATGDDGAEEDEDDDEDDDELDEEDEGSATVVAGTVDEPAEDAGDVAMTVGRRAANRFPRGRSLSRRSTDESDDASETSRLGMRGDLERLCGVEVATSAQDSESATIMRC